MEYLIVKLINPTEMAYSNPPRNRPEISGVVNVNRQESNENTDSSWNGEVFFSRTYSEALFFVDWLTRRHPNSSYTIAKSTDVYSRTPGPLVHSIYSDAGLLPA